MGGLCLEIGMFRVYWSVLVLIWCCYLWLDVCGL